MTSMNIPNSITNGTVADATDVQQNFDHIESHVNTEVVNRDGSIAMTGELLLPSNPTSNLAAATKSYVDGKDSAMDTRVTALEGTDIVVTLTGDVTGTGTITDLGDVSFVTTVVDDSHNHVVGNIDNFTENVQDIVGAMVSDNTESGISVTYDDADGTLDFNVADPTITLTGDVTGSATMTNLGNVSITATVGDDTHSHTNYLTSSSSLNGDKITSGTVADARIASTITRDSEVSSSGWGLYGRSTATNVRASNAYYTIWVTDTTPTASTLRTGDIWIDT